MLCCAVQSGSNGNSYYIESKDTKIVIDCGLSGKIIRDRLHQIDRSCYDLDGAFITHDHSDHSCGIGISNRLFNLPVFVTKPTYEACLNKTGELEYVEHFISGDEIAIGYFKIKSYKTPHDAVDAVVFTIDDGERRVGILTDLGNVFNGLHSIVSSCDVVYIESNYEDEILEKGNYPRFLKNRIRGKHGHISNVESAKLIRDCKSDKLKHVVLSHISENNNTPEIAYNTHKRIYGDKYHLSIAYRYRISKPIII